MLLLISALAKYIDVKIVKFKYGGCSLLSE